MMRISKAALLGMALSLIISPAAIATRGSITSELYEAPFNEPLTQGGILVAAIVGIHKSANIEEKDKLRIQRFIAMVDRLIGYVDFDIISFSEAKQEIDDAHDSAMRYNSIANILVSGMSGILPAALQYPHSTVSVAATNNIGIIGSGCAIASSAIALSKASATRAVPESTLLAAILQGSGDQSGPNKIYPYSVYCFLKECTLQDLGYVGTKIVKMEKFKARKDTVQPDWAKERARSGLDWLICHWKKHYGDTYTEIKEDKDAALIGESGEFKTFKRLNSDSIADRIEMLKELRILLEGARWCALDLASKTDKLSDFTERAVPCKPDSSSVHGEVQTNQN
jgi:hypothetical protein